MLFGLAAIVWLARKAGPSVGRTAVLGGGAFVGALVALVSCLGVVSGTVGAGAWVTVAIEGVLAAGFLYFLLADRKERLEARVS